MYGCDRGSEPEWHGVGRGLNNGMILTYAYLILSQLFKQLILILQLILNPFFSQYQFRRFVVGGGEIYNHMENLPN